MGNETDVANPPGSSIIVIVVPVPSKRERDATASDYCDSHVSPKTDSNGSASSSDSGVATDVCARPRQRRRHGDVYYWNKSKYRHSGSGRSCSDADSSGSDAERYYSNTTPHSSLMTRVKSVAERLVVSSDVVPGGQFGQPLESSHLFVESY